MPHPSPLRPFRLALLTATPEEILAANAAEERVGEACFLEADLERLEIEICFRPTRHMVERWLQHPDERVTLDFLRKYAKEPSLMEVTGHRPSDFVPFLLQRAEREKLLWTPLLQEMSESQYWPLRTREGMEYVNHGQESEPQLEKLLPYIQRQTEWASIEALLQFNNGNILALVLRHSPCIPFDRLKEWAGKVEHLRDLVENPTLSESARSFLLLSTWPHRRSNSQGGEAFKRLGEQELPMRDDIFDRLFRTPLQKQKMKSSYGADPNHERKYDLLQYPALSEAQLLEIVTSMSSRDGYTWSHAAAHPSSNLVVWQEALKHTGDSSDTIRALARNPRARQHAEIRSILVRLATAGDLQLFYEMQEDLTVEEAALYIRGAAGNSTHRRNLASWLEKGNMPAGLTAEMLAPACNSSDQRLRLAAIQALGRLSLEAESLGVRQSDNTPLRPR